MKVLTLAEIKKRVEVDAIIAGQEEAFVAYSQGKVISPPVGHLQFLSPPGDCHIKYGMIANDEIYVIKIASGFYDNPKQNLSSSHGLMLIHCAKTGIPLILLQDEGYLTDLRTAIAGLICAKYLAPQSIHGIGIFGTGTQARLQLQLLKLFTSCKNVYVWGRTAEKLATFKAAMAMDGFDIKTTLSAQTVLQNCNLIITTTPSQQPLFSAKDVHPGTHITAIGADSPGKQELDADLFLRARWFVDSRTQSVLQGETQHIPQIVQLIELGEVIANPSLGRENATQITVADLTGLAAQDIQIAKTFTLAMPHAGAPL